MHWTWVDCTCALDDTMTIVKSWFDAGRPVEFHLYQHGGLGFGLGNPNRTSNRWFEAFIHWLDVNRFLASNPGK